MVNIKESHENLINKLKDPKEADFYFSTILEKCKNLEKDEADKLLSEALANLAQACPEKVNIDVNKRGLIMNSLLRFLRFISKKLNWTKNV